MLILEKMIFKDSMAIIKNDILESNSYGFMDRNWQIILEPYYDKIYDSVGDYAIVSKLIDHIKYYGIINSNLTEIISPSLKQFYGDTGFDNIKKEFHMLTDETKEIKYEERPKIIKKIKLIQKNK